jgi:hypothetical protein
VTQTLPRVRFPKFPYEVKMAIVSVLIAPGALYGGWEIARVTDQRTDVAASVIVVTETARAPETTSMTPTPKAGEREVGARPVRSGPVIRTSRTASPAPTTASVPTTAPSETSSVRTTSASPTSVSETETGSVDPVCHTRCTSEEPPVRGLSDSQLGDPTGN